MKIVRVLTFLMVFVFLFGANVQALVFYSDVGFLFGSVSVPADEAITYSIEVTNDWDVPIVISDYDDVTDALYFSISAYPETDIFMVGETKNIDISYLPLAEGFHIETIYFSFNEIDNLSNFDIASLTVEGAGYVSHETPVPEPATILLLGTGLVGLAGIGRKKFFYK